MQKANATLKIIILLQAIALLLLLYNFKRSSFQLQDGIPQVRESLSRKSSGVEVVQISKTQFQTPETKQSNTHEVDIRVSKLAPPPTLKVIGIEHNNTKQQTLPKTKAKPVEVPTNSVLNNYLSYPDKKPLELSCETCAFVTSSGHLTGKGLGAEIDLKDCVFRSNDAPIVGYQTDVGRRTTIRTVDKRSMNFLVEKSLKNQTAYPSLKETSVIYVKIYNIEELLSNATKRLPSLKTYYVSKELLKTINNLFKVEVLNSTKIEKGQWTSNGFATIVIARDICKEIHVYGITEPNHCEKVVKNKLKDVPYHYYKVKGLRNECDFFNLHLEKGRGHHSFTKEKIAFKNLQKKWGNIFFHAPEWEDQKERKTET